MANELTNQEFWDKIWKDNLIDEPLRNFFFKDIISVIGHPIGKLAMELGCVPGDNLIYLNTNFGYKVSGIDFSTEIHNVKKRLEKYGIFDSEIINADILSYNFQPRYDLVFSMGLVEHFLDPIPILLKHYEALKVGGWIFIALPNFRYFHYITRYFADRDVLMKHNTLLMSPRRFRKFIGKMNLKTYYCDYYGDFDFWLENRQNDWRSVVKRKIAFTVAKCVRYIYRFKPFRGKISAFFSPWVVFLGKKSG